MYFRRVSGVAEVWTCCDVDGGGGVFQASKWCSRGVDVLASQGIEQCNTEAGAEAALNDIDSLMQQVGELKLADAHELCTQLPDPSMTVCVLSLCDGDVCIFHSRDVLKLEVLASDG